jgi:hypothetical protein
MTRPQFGALWEALGASDAMAFDSGGSAEVVARVLGDPGASVLGSPSDGEERRVADGLFIYSDAPQGAPARLVVRPSTILALPNVSVPVRLAVTDAAGHPLATPVAHGPIDSGSTSRTVTVRADGLSAAVPVEVVSKPALLVIGGTDADPDPHGDVTLSVTGYDASGREVALGDAVRWSANGATFVAPGTLRVGAHDARVTVSVAGVSAQTNVAVGHRDVPLALFAGDRLDLPYDFSRGGRFAYAQTNVTLPAGAFAFSVETIGDGSGVGVRAAFVNRFGERRAFTLAKAVDWRGPKTLSIVLPDDLTPPVRIVSLYAVDGLGGVATHASGALTFRAPLVTVAGTP